MTVLRNVICPGIALITVNRPEKLNSISRATDTLIRKAPAWAEQNDEVRGFVLTATDRAFCTGDITQLLLDTRERGAVNADDGTVCGLTRVHPTSKTIVAAVNGVAFGGDAQRARPDPRPRRHRYPGIFLSRQAGRPSSTGSFEC